MVRLRHKKTVGLHESHYVFREERSCIDVIFTMAELVNKFGASKRPLLAFLLDIKRAYVVVWREGLFFNLKAKGAQCKLWRVLLDFHFQSRIPQFALLVRCRNPFHYW